VEVEDITRIGFTTGGTTEEEGHLTVGNSLLGEIVIDNQSVLAVVTEPFTHSASREGSEVLEGGSLRGSGGDDDGVLHGVVLLKGLDELSDGGSLLAYGDVDTVELLGLVSALVPSLLVEDGVNGDGGLSGLTITNDQLTLATTNRNHGVDGLETGHHRLVDGATGQDTGGLDGGTATLGSLNGTLAVNGVTKGVDDTSKETRADGDVDNLASSLDGVALLDETIVTEDGDTDVVGFQVETHATDTRGEFHHLFGCNRNG
jgi:hypothetical protein